MVYEIAKHLTYENVLLLPIVLFVLLYCFRYYRGAVGALLVYDKAKHLTYENILLLRCYLLFYLYCCIVTGITVEQ